MDKLVSKIKLRVPALLNSLYQEHGFFSWSLNHDLYSHSIKWGLANTVFAIKLYYLLGELTNIPKQQKDDIFTFIKSFQHADGSFNDPLIYNKTSLLNKLVAIKHLNFSDFFNHKTIMAETRQAMVALLLLHKKPDKPYQGIPYSRKNLVKYIKGLHWENAWAAASHVSHEVFFLKMNAQLFAYENHKSKSLIKYCLEAIEKIQHHTDGMWYVTHTSTKQKVNAAMKMITTCNLLEDPTIPYADKIIDFVLASEKENYYCDGCDNLNAIFVLKYAFDSCEKNYRVNDVRTFSERSLNRIEKYFFEKEGGFSFLSSPFARKLYGLQITHPFKGADIHGTFLLTWAVALATDLLEMDVGLKSNIIN